jgi:uncharacterized membrane protein YdbT with pleckstrin-like domain
VAINPKLLNEGEHVVVSLRTHPKALLLPLLVLVVLLAVGAFVQQVGSGTAGEVLHIVVWVLVAVGVLWFAVRPAVAWATTTYTFTNKRFIKRSGFIAKEGRTIPLNRISGVDFEIGVIDRIFGCGTLVVSDASEHGHVLLDDIPRVEEVQRTVAAELDRLTGHRSGDGA